MLTVCLMFQSCFISKLLEVNQKLTLILHVDGGLPAPCKLRSHSIWCLVLLLNTKTLTQTLERMVTKVNFFSSALAGGFDNK